MIHNTKYLILICLIFSLPLAIKAQDSKLLSLDDILKKIEKQNVLLESYALKAKSFAYKSEAANSWMAPMVGAGTYMTPYPGQNPMEDNKGSVMFQVEQDIPNFAKLKANRKAIASRSDIEDANREIALNELKSQAKSLYFNWIISLKRIKLLQENQQIIRTMKEIENIRYKYNQGQLGNIFNIEAKIDENQSSILMQEGEILKYRAWLNSLMNEEGNVYFDIDTSETLNFSMEVSLDTSYLAANRMDIAKMEREISTMKFETESIRAGRRPGFKIRLDHMSPLGNGMMPNSYSVMGMISIPIAPWSSKMYKNEVSANILEVEGMEKQRTGMLMEIRGRLYGMQQQILTMQKQVDLMENKIIPSLKRALDANFQSYQENKIQLPVIIDNWESWNMMQNNLLDEKLKLYQMIINYETELFR